MSPIAEEEMQHLGELVLRREGLTPSELADLHYLMLKYTFVLLAEETIGKEKGE